jgi:hypothetical protein
VVQDCMEGRFLRDLLTDLCPEQQQEQLEPRDLGQKWGVFMDWNKSDFILDGTYLVYFKITSERQAHPWSQGLVIKSTRDSNGLIYFWPAGNACKNGQPGLLWSSHGGGTAAQPRMLPS